LGDLLVESEHATVSRREVSHRGRFDGALKLHRGRL